MPTRLFRSEALRNNVFRAFLCAAISCGFSAPRSLHAGQGRDAGLERMAHPELLPYFLPVGTETKQFISYDTSGSNSDGNFENAYTKYVDANGEFVVFDAYGPGCLFRQQMNVWFANPASHAGAGRIKYYFDNETTPRLDMTVDEFFGGAAAPYNSPFSFMDRAKRFAIQYYPFPFRTRLKVTTTDDLNQHFKHAHISYPAAWHQYTYLSYPADADVRTWTGPTEDSARIRKQWNNLGADPKSAEGNLSTAKTVAIRSGDTANVLDLAGRGSIARLKIAMAPFSKATFYNAHIRIYWDGAATPAVDMPIGYFFGGGGSDYSCGNEVWKKTLKTLFFGFDKTGGVFYAYWPMPYWSSAKIDIYNKSGEDITSLTCDVEYKPAAAYAYSRGEAGHFHAKRTVDGDAGGGLFTNVFEERGKGHVVGLSFYTDGFAMDGDEFTYIDGSRTPQMHGDGTEDDHNQGWGGDAYQKPLWGGLINGFQGAYRIYMNDPYVFNKHIKINYEFSRDGGGDNGGRSDVVVYYYKAAATDNLKLTDQLDVGNPDSEREHSYSITGQTWSGTVDSGYDGYERDYEYDRCIDDGRAYNGDSRFTIKIDPENNGVKLRRRIDRSNNGLQLADVYIDDVKVAARPWDICTPSAAPNYQSWFDADFEIPAALTRGKSSIRVKVQYRNAANKPELNEFYYWAFSYVPLPTDGTAPTPVASLTAKEAGVGKIDLKWTAAADASGINFYRIYRSTRSDFSDAATIGRSNAITFSDTRVKPGAVYYYKVAATDIANNEGPLSSQVHAAAAADSRPASAKFLGVDSTTSGDWGGAYGNEGFLMMKYFFGRDCKALPSYISAVDYGTLASYQFSLWHNPQAASLVSTPLMSSKSGLGCLWTATGDSVTLHANDARMHRMALYLCDFDNFGGGRDEDIEILDLNDNVLSPAQNIKGFQKGKWLRYSFSGSIKIRLTNRNPQANAVISAIMLDDADLAEGKTYRASTEWNSEYSAAKACDGDINTRWSSAGKETDSAWLEVDFGAATAFDAVAIKECITWSQTKSFQIQYWDGAQWRIACTGTTIGHSRMCAFNPVRGSKMRILFTNSVGGCPSIWQVKVFDRSQNAALPSM
ncbi:MAG: DUF2961 domain-containing protein [Pirellulales bacterium]|nr:DUF2961 domain-containing protein [Pirellulales bacterium]